MSYDKRVYELVEHFLSGVPEKNTERKGICWLSISRTSWRTGTFMLLPERREDAHPADGL